eukprot:g18198.t1
MCWEFWHSGERADALLFPLETGIAGGPTQSQLGLRRVTFYNWATDPEGTEQRRYTDEWMGGSQGRLVQSSAMGNQCAKRFFLSSEEYYRQKFAEEATKKQRVEDEEKEAALRMVQEEQEEAMRAEEARKAEEVKMLALLGRLFAEDAGLQKQVNERLETLTKPMMDKVADIAKQLTPTKDQVDHIAKIATELEPMKVELRRLDTDLELHANRVDEIELEKNAGTEKLGKLEGDCRSFVQQVEEKLNKVIDSNTLMGRDLQMHKLEIYEDIKKMGEMIKERGLELGALREADDEDTGALKLGLSSLESTTREVIQEVKNLKERINMLSEEAQFGEGWEEEEDGGGNGEETAAGASSNSANHKCNTNKCVRKFLDAAKKRAGSMEELSCPPVNSDSDSDSDNENITIPRKMGKNGVNSIDLIDWESLRRVQKKNKSSLDKFDEITMRTLNDPPQRGSLEWRRWKETVYLWALALRKVRANFCKMGQMLLNKSFVGHEGEYSMAVSASTTRDLVEIMLHLDTKFSIPVRAIIEKREEIIPKIVRLDGQSPVMFLQLLNMIFIREAEISTKGARSDHNKAMRGLSALRLEHNTEQLIKSKLPTEVDEMEFLMLENLIDTLGVKDTVRYDATGKKHEPNKAGEKDWISELMVAMGERMRGDSSSHSTHMNNYFNVKSNTTAGAAGGLHYTTPNQQEPGGPVGGQNFATPGGPGAPAGGAPTKDSRVELRAKDAQFWRDLAKTAEPQKEVKLKARMENLLSKKNQKDYWCEFGDWCESVPKTGDCIRRHTGPEFGRLIRKFEDNNPAGYAKWKKVQDERKKAEQQQKAAAKATTKARDRQQTESKSSKIMCTNAAEGATSEQNASYADMVKITPVQQSTGREAEKSKSSEKSKPSTALGDENAHSLEQAARETKQPSSRQSASSMSDIQMSPEQRASEVPSVHQHQVLLFTEAKRGSYEAGTYDRSRAEFASHVLFMTRSPDSPLTGLVLADTGCTHNPMPESIYRNVQHLCPGGKVLLGEEVRSGTAANDREDESAPRARYYVILFFRVNNCDQLFQAKFVIVDGGSVASFPLILGLPFMHEYGVDISMKTKPPQLKIGADTFQCAEQPLPMVELTFVEQHTAVGRYPVFKSSIEKAIDSVEGDDTSTDADCEATRSRSGSPESSVQEEALNLYTTPSSPVTWQPQNAATRVRLSVAQMLYSADEDLLLNEAFLEEVGNIIREDGENNPAEAAAPANEETPAEKKERLRKQALRTYMQKEHRSLGHSKTAELLFEGEALEVLREVRAACRLCGMYDDAHAIRTRGALLQFAPDRNVIWIMDALPTRVGLLIKVLDACSRFRHAELVDTHPAYGGKVGAAIRCFHAAKRRMGGEPETLVVDLGSELVSTRFKHCVGVVNTKIKVVGFKAAHKISKIEQDNGPTRMHLNKLVNPPFEPWLELLLWSYATHSEDQEFFEFDHADLIKQVLKIRVDANDYPEETEVKRLLIEEYLWQTNNKPILGTCLSSQNFHAGSFARGTRDWEFLYEETLVMGHGSKCEADVFMQRAAKVQRACTDVVVSRDLEMYARRREIVSRTYKRGRKLKLKDGEEEPILAKSFPLGMRVYVRRDETSKFHKYVDGEVQGTDEHQQTVAVRVNGKTLDYDVTDVATEKPADTGSYVAEFFPDQDMLDLVRDRGGVVVFDNEVDEEEQNNQEVLHVPRRDLFYKLKDGVSTHKPKSVGGSDDDLPLRDTDRAKAVQLQVQEERLLAETLVGAVSVMPLDYPYHHDAGFRDHVKWAQEEDLTSFRWRGRIFHETNEGKWELDQSRSDVEEEPRSGIESYFGDSIFDGEAPAPLGSIARHVVEETTINDRLGADGLGPAGPREVESQVETLAEARTRRHAARQERLERLDAGRVKAPKRPRPAEPVVSSSSSSDFSSSDSMVAPEVKAMPPTEKKLKTSTVANFVGYTSARHHQLKDKQRVQLADGERLFQGGILNEKVRKQVNRFKTSVELTVGNGEIFLASSAEAPDSDVARAYDFTALPIIDKLLRKSARQTQTFKLLKGPNQVCFSLSQLLNGRCIKGELTAKDNRDVQYVVVEAQIHRDKAGGHLDPGRHCNLRFGPGHTPTFIDDEEAKREVADTWVVRMYYEACADSHEAVETYAAGTKSTSLTVDLEDARKLGFASYAYAACCAEVRAVDGNGVLGKRYKRSELEALGKKNIVTSRWLLVVKVERVSGKFQRVKARWITHGFKDLRYRRGNGQEPNARSYTLGDATFIALVQFLQARRVPPSLGDIKEAFLRGMEFTELYEDVEDQEVFLQIPRAIIEMEIEGVEPLDECVQQVKSLYGNKDAPMGWEKKWWQACGTAGLQQSVSDPSLWLYYANAAEQQAMVNGTEKEHFLDMLDKLKRIPKKNLESRVKLLEAGSRPREVEVAKARSSHNVVNPHSLVLNGQVLPHSQRKDDPLGAMGMHVDDSLSGGELLFHLRAMIVFEFFELGSFTTIGPGQRENYVGREIMVVPMCFDQLQLQKHLATNSDRVAASGFAPLEGTVEQPTEEELKAAEATTGIARDLPVTEYPTSKSIQYDPMWFLENNRVEMDVVYYISQASYAAKMKEITSEEIKEYIRKRRVTTNFWAKKELKSPIRGKLGELIWLQKCNGVICEEVSRLAGEAHIAEQLEDLEEIDLFLARLNNIILISQLPETNTRRVYYLAPLRKHYLGSGGDAGMERLGGTAFLAAEAVLRTTHLSMHHGKPKRVFHSSTGIELLCQRIQSSENVFLSQILFDLSLTQINRAVLQISDSRNCTSEPSERNLKPDHYSLAMLIREGLLEVKHGPGPDMWADGFTKPMRQSNAFLLHLAVNWGLLNASMMKVVLEHVGRIAKREQDRADQLQELIEKNAERDLKGEEELSSDSEDDGEAGAGIYTCCAGAVMRIRGGNTGFWTEDIGSCQRVHNAPRNWLATPVCADVSEEEARKWFLTMRTTRVTFQDEEGGSVVVEDTWHVGEQKPVCEGSLRPWTGTTTFYKRAEFFDKMVLPKRAKANPFVTPNSRGTPTKSKRQVAPKLHNIPDIWIESENNFQRKHTTSRVARFTPVGVGGMSEENAKKWVGEARVTRYRFDADSTALPMTQIQDLWRSAPGKGHAPVLDGARWTGTTTFPKRAGMQGKWLWTKPEDEASSGEELDPATNTANA